MSERKSQRWAVAETEVLHKVIEERLEMSWSLWNAAEEAGLQLQRTALQCYNKYKYDISEEERERRKKRRLENLENKKANPFPSLSSVPTTIVEAGEVRQGIIPFEEDVREVRIEFKDIRVDMANKQLVIIL